MAEIETNLEDVAEERTAELTIVIGGIRYRKEDAIARGLIGDLPATGEGPRALSLTAAQVDVDALARARADHVETELRKEYEARTAQLEQEHAERLEQLETEFELRVEQTVTERLAEKEDTVPENTEGDGATPDGNKVAAIEDVAQTPPAEPAVKPSNRAAKPATK